LWNFLTFKREFIPLFAAAIGCGRCHAPFKATDVDLIINVLAEGDEHLLHSWLSERDSVGVIQDFVLWGQSRSQYFEPFCRMQDTMRAKLIGHKFWMDLAERRFHHLHMIDPFYVHKCSKETRKSYRIVYRLKHHEPSEKCVIAKRFGWSQRQITNVDNDESELSSAIMHEGNETAEIESFENISS
jgi:hypothetical protein